MNVHDPIVDAAHAAVLDRRGVTLLLDGVRDADLAPVADWLATYTEWQRLGRHLIREADQLTPQTT